MKRNELELKSYINSTEKMSGFDSYDSEGDMSYFDGDAFDYFDDDSSNADGGSQVGVSDPYILQYQNTGTTNVTAYIFGYNLYFGTTNYGNPTAAVITNLQGSATYTQLMSQSQNKPFRIGKFRFQSSTASQLQVTLSIVHVDANGKQYSTPLNLATAIDAYQYQGTVLDVVKPVTVDGNTYISFTLIASATMTITMFPTSIISAKAKLNNGQILNQARAPRLSGKNVAPVIIQTTSGVASLNKG